MSVRVQVPRASSLCQPLTSLHPVMCESLYGKTRQTRACSEGFVLLHDMCSHQSTYPPIKIVTLARKALQWMWRTPQPHVASQPGSEQWANTTLPWLFCPPTTRRYGISGFQAIQGAPVAAYAVGPALYVTVTAALSSSMSLLYMELPGCSICLVVRLSKSMSLGAYPNFGASWGSVGYELCPSTPNHCSHISFKGPY